MHPRRPPLAIVLALSALLGVAAPAAGAESASQLAADKGCYNCHGTEGRRNVRTFRQIVADYAAHRGRPEMLQQLVDRMHDGGLFSHVAAHERLTEEEARQLVQWLIDGGQ